MKQNLMFLAVAAIVGSALITVPMTADAAKRSSKASTPAAPKSPHKFKAEVGLQFRTNTDIKVAPSSSDSFNLADFSDFEEAEAKLDGDDEDDDDSDDFGDDDFDDVGIDDAELSQEDYDLAVDDDDGDGNEDDPDDDGMDGGGGSDANRLLIFYPSRLLVS